MRASTSLLVALSLVCLAPAAVAKPAAKPHTKPTAKATPAPEASDAAGNSTKELLERQFILPADGPYAVTIQNLRGRVLARGWNKNVLYVHVVKHTTHPVSGTEADYYDGTGVGIATPNKHTVTLTTSTPASELTSVAAERIPHVMVDFELYIPPDCALTIKQENGPVTVVNVSGKVEAFSRDGDIALTNVDGWAEAENERGNITVADVTGDAVGRSVRGNLNFRGVSGDVKAATGTGKVRIDVPPRFAGEVAYQTVSGLFRSDLTTFHTDMEPGDKGYRGVLRGPLADLQRPLTRYMIDTESGDATVATDRRAGQ